MALTPERAYGYDDLLLVPQHSRLEGRLDTHFNAHIPGTSIFLDIPIFSAPMDTVTESDMAVFMAAYGGMGIIHRYMDIEDQAAEVRKVKESTDDRLGRTRWVGASVGGNESQWRTKALIDAGVDLICIDVAHGDSLHVLDHIKWIHETYPSTPIMSGNIATPSAAINSIYAGATVLRIGIGAGSACTTRLVTGVGVPQLSAISSIYEAVKDYRRILVADGGIRQSGDIVKALAAGADAVMLGGILSKYPVSPMPGKFRGMASSDALMSYKGKRHTVGAEGESFNTTVIEDYEKHYQALVSAVQQGMAYLGAANIRELRENAQWVEVSPLGQRESPAHFGGS